MNSMNLIFGDVTERRSPTLTDCHYIKKLTFHLYNCLLYIFAIFAGSFKSQLIDYFRWHIVSWEAFGRFMLIRTK